MSFELGYWRKEYELDLRLYGKGLYNPLSKEDLEDLKEWSKKQNSKLFHSMVEPLEAAFKALAKGMTVYYEAG